MHGAPLPTAQRLPCKRAAPEGGNADTAKAMASVLEAVAEGDITPSEGTAIAGIIEHHRRAIETTEIEERLRTLEDQKP